VHDTYADVIADPDGDLVNNALVNSLQARWNITALQAGKHVLSEKPLTSNAEEARAVRAAARASSGQIVEGLHHLHHPVNLRLRELVTSGALGDILRVDLVLRSRRRRRPTRGGPRGWPAGQPWTWAAMCSTRPARSDCRSKPCRRS
jgi:predicted dehydrogenase